MAQAPSPIFPLRQPPALGTNMAAPAPLPSPTDAPLVPNGVSGGRPAAPKPIGMSGSFGPRPPSEVVAPPPPAKPPTPAPAVSAPKPPASKADIAEARAKVADARAAAARASADAAKLTATVAPPPTTPQPAGTAATTTTETVGPDGMTDAQRAQQEQEIAQANATKLGEVAQASAQGTADEMAAKAKADADAKAKADADAAAAAKATPTDPFKTLIDTATAALTATDDPLAKVKFNQAIQNIGLQNQAATDALKMKIAADPSLRGQGAGNAMLNLTASQMNMNVDQLIGQMTSESIQRIIDLNKWGFDQLNQVTQERENYQQNLRNDLLNAGDIDGWANLMEQQTGVQVDRAALKEASPTTLKLMENLTLGITNSLKDGDEARARTLFDQLKAAAPNQFGSMTFEDFVSKRDLWTESNAAKQETLTAIRDRIADGDVASAISGLQSLYSEDESAANGRKLLTDGMTLDEANRLLTQAGYDKVASLDDMIGLEDELYISSELDKLKKGLEGADTFNQMVLNESKELAQYLGVDALTPEMQQGLKEFLYQARVTGGIVMGDDGNFHFAEGAQTPPWLDPKAPSAVLYQAWPLPGQTTFSADFPAEGSALAERNKQLDTAYTAYVTANPDPASHMTREQWYQAVVKANNGNDIVVVEDGPASDYHSITEYNKAKADAQFKAWEDAGGGTAGNTAAAEAGAAFERDNVKPTGTATSGYTFDVTKTGTTVTPTKYVGKDYGEVDTLIKGESDPANVPWDSKEVKDWVDKQPYVAPTAIKSISDFVSNYGKGSWVKIGNDLVRIEDNVQRRIGSESGDFRHKDYMIVTMQDGSKRYYATDGRWTTTPPPEAPPSKQGGGDSRLNKIYKPTLDWFNSMQAA